MAKSKEKPPAVGLIGQGYEAEVDIQSITPHPDNPNQGNETAILESVSSIGFYGAVICQKQSRTILVGEHRWKAAKKRKAKTIPVVWVECDDLEAIRIMLADNRTADLARYREAERAALLRTCTEQYGKAFLAGTGFTDADLVVQNSALESLTRGSVKGKDGSGASIAGKAAATAVTFSIGRVKFKVDSDLFGEWLQQLEQESLETGRSIEQVAASRMGMELWV